MSVDAATKIPDFQPIFNIYVAKMLCLRSSAPHPAGGLQPPRPPDGKRLVTHLQRSPTESRAPAPRYPTIRHWLDDAIASKSSVTSRMCDDMDIDNEAYSYFCGTITAIPLFITCTQKNTLFVIKRHAYS